MANDAITNVRRYIERVGVIRCAFTGPLSGRCKRHADPYSRYCYVHKAWERRRG